jgi:MoaD family protein
LNYVKVRVLYFARAREFTGTKEDEFLLTAPASMKHLFSRVLSTHPKLEKISGILRPLVNGRMITDDVELKDGDRVAIVPPVAGG